MSQKRSPDSDSSGAIADSNAAHCGTLVHRFIGHTSRIFSLALCTLRDGTRLTVSGSHDRTIRIWNLSTFQHVRTVVFSDFIWRVFIAKGVKCDKTFVIAFISAEEKVQVCDIETGEILWTFTGKLIFAGNSPLFEYPFILISNNDSGLHVYDAETGQLTLTFTSGFEKIFRAVVSLHVEIPIIIFTTWNATTRKSTMQSYNLVNDVNLSARSRNFKTSKNSAKSEQLQETTTVSEEVRIKSSLTDQGGDKSLFRTVFEGDSQNGVTSVAVSSYLAKPIFVSGHYDNSVRVWSLNTLEFIRMLEGHHDWVASVALWRSAEPIAISGSSDGTIKVWCLQTGEELSSCEAHAREISSVACTYPDCPRDRYYLNKLRHSQETLTPPTADSNSNCNSTSISMRSSLQEEASYHPNSASSLVQKTRLLLVSVSADRTVAVWDVNQSIYRHKWARRKDFCMFIVGMGFMPLRKSSKCVDISSYDEKNTYSFDGNPILRDGDDGDNNDNKNNKNNKNNNSDNSSGSNSYIHTAVEESIEGDNIESVNEATESASDYFSSPTFKQKTIDSGIEAAAADSVLAPCNNCSTHIESDLWRSSLMNVFSSIELNSVIASYF